MNGFKIFNEMIGQTFDYIRFDRDDDNIIEFYKFKDDEYPTYTLEHKQSCCENVYIESITGDLNDLVNEPILMAECVWKDGSENHESSTWSFVKFATRKGYVDVRFFGSSNGYYSEKASIYKMVTEDGYTFDEECN